MEKSFRQLLRESLKSGDTEETLDVYFTRPIGLVFALMWIRLGATPNFVTILSMFLGAGAGYCFYHTELWWNVCGVLLLMLANFCDSTDGQMARLTNHRTTLGRILDGLASDVWFFCCYLAIALRLWHQPIPLVSHLSPLTSHLSPLTSHWGIWGYLLCAYAGFYWHARQCQLADYYRQIHLFFLKGEAGSELSSYDQQRRLRDALPPQGHFLQRTFLTFYMGWCRRQESVTPAFQRFFSKVKERWPNAADIPADLREAFRKRSLPLMWMTNTLTHNTRAIVLFVACLIDQPWLYPLFEITVLAALYYYMRHRHEAMCRDFCLSELSL